MHAFTIKLTGDHMRIVCFGFISLYFSEATIWGLHFF